MSQVKGKIWKLGDNIDTDVIVSGQYLDAPIDEVIRHVLESIRPEFVKEVKKGDIIVAGKNFGCGSSRENAPAAIQKLGIACIVAESFARIFFRNSIAIGLPVVICKDVTGIFNEGERAVIEFRKAHVENLNSGAALQGELLSDEILSIVEKKGILEMLKCIRKKS
jgi:3-isopropylmalate dehydratase small subunit